MFRNKRQGGNSEDSQMTTWNKSYIWWLVTTNLYPKILFSEGLKTPPCLISNYQLNAPPKPQIPNCILLLTSLLIIMTSLRKSSLLDVIFSFISISLVFMINIDLRYHVWVVSHGGPRFCFCLNFRGRSFNVPINRKERLHVKPIQRSGAHGVQRVCFDFTL